MSNDINEKYEDRYGSDYEEGKGANSQNIENRKFGIKSTDTLADKILKMKKKGAFDEEKKAEMPEINDEEDNDGEDEENNKELFDHEEEKRIALMQYLNPRILKSREKKEYMSKANIQEGIAARLNEIASAKLDLYKKAIAINATVDLSEARRMSAAEKLGRASDLEQQRSALSRQRGIELLKTPESIRAAHDALHSKSATEEESEVDQLDEASRNPNVMRQGRTKIVKARVRGGKVQRRKRLSAVKGYTIRGGKLKRMSMAERLRRKRGQRRGKIKRKAKMARALMKRKRSMRRRASLGLKE
jgi:hypothetical protein